MDRWMVFFEKFCSTKKSSLIKLMFFIIATTQPSISLASFDSLTYSSGQENRYEIEKLQNQLQQADFDRQIDALNRQTETLRRQQENEDIKISLEAAEQARQITENEAREAAEAAAEDTKNEILRSSIMAKNNLYLIFTMLTIAGFFTYFIKTKRDSEMNDNQKYGVIVMLSSFILIILVLMVSVEWTNHLDYLENLMNTLQFRFFETKTEIIPSATSTFIYHTPEFEYSYAINIPSKYLVLLLLATSSYGLTTYLGITAAFKPWKDIDES